VLRHKSELVFKALTRGIETSIGEMLPAFTRSDENSLENISQLSRELDGLGLICNPQLTKGTSEDKRILKRIQETEIDVNELKQKLRYDEDQKMELKSSLLYSFNEAAARPDQPPSKLNHEPVLHSVLKTICAFANSDGGELFIGVDDDGDIKGIEYDYLCSSTITDCDTWLTFLKNIIKTNFHSGQSILMYLSFKVIEVDQKNICAINVVNSEEIQFLKEKRKSSNYKCYYRSTNGTEEIHIQDLPAFVRTRQKIL